MGVRGRDSHSYGRAHETTDLTALAFTVGKYATFKYPQWGYLTLALAFN